MATEVALAAEENGKIVSAVYPKSYLPSHGVCYETSNCILCIFADAIRTGYAEAKAKRSSVWSYVVGCNPHRIRRGKARSAERSEAESRMQSAQDTPRQSTAKV